MPDRPSNNHANRDGPSSSGRSQTLAATSQQKYTAAISVAKFWLLGLVFALLWDLLFPQAISSPLQSAGIQVFLALALLCAVTISPLLSNKPKLIRLLCAGAFFITASAPYVREFARAVDGRYRHQIWRVSYLPVVATLSTFGPCAAHRSEPHKQLTLCFRFRHSTVVSSLIVARRSGTLPEDLNNLTIADKRVFVRGEAYDALTSEEQRKHDQALANTVGQYLIDPICCGFYLLRIDEMTG
ncbi:MAG: hypothetical protein HOP09_06365 [Hyphomicrobium sp.]|nr:hypothetical protein [Hyphomicrobium sp.]